MLAKPAEKLLRCFYIVFIAAFTWLFINVVFFNTHFAYQAPWVILCAGVWLLVFFALCASAEKAKAFLCAREKRCLVAAFLLLLLYALLFYVQVGAYPARDWYNVYTGAYNYTIAGIIEDPFLDYFYKFPNNMPITIVLQFLFRVFYKFGVTNFLAVGALFNVFCIGLTYLFVYLCCRELLGVPWAFLSLAVLALCVPLHCYISVFYTDTTTMLFAPLAFYLYLKAQKAQKSALRYGLIVFGGMLLGFGMALKYSVVITAVALAIDMLLHKRFRLMLAALASTAAGFLLWSMLFNSFMYAHILDKNLAEDRATPLLSWVMMGLGGDGAHNPEDNYLVWNEESKADKQAVTLRTLRQRLNDFGPFGYLQFLNAKGVRSFGSGTLGAEGMPADSPMRQTFLVECISPAGRFFSAASHVFQGYHVLLFSLIVAGAALALKRRDYRFTVPLVSIFGLYLFLLLWEAGHRYLVNYMGVFVTAAVFGLFQILQKRGENM